MTDPSTSGPLTEPRWRLRRPEERRQDRRHRRLEALQETHAQVPITFVLVGVQKAATSTLYRMLVKHPEVVAGPEKELRFFDDEYQDWDQPDYSTYKRPMTSSTSRLAGDATPSYFFWPRALERMHRYDPDLRLLLSVRDPVERAMSQWSMQRHRDPSFPDVGEAFARWGGMHVPDAVPAGTLPVELRVTSLFARGHYGRQFERGLSLFDREQWCVQDFGVVVTDPRTALDSVTDFLGLRRFTRYPALKQRSATPRDHHGRPLTTRDVERLVDLYAEDLARFARLSGLDITAWPTQRVLAGQLSVEDFTGSLMRKLGLTS